MSRDMDAWNRIADLIGEVGVRGDRKSLTKEHRTHMHICITHNNMSKAWSGERVGWSKAKRKKMDDICNTVNN